MNIAILVVLLFIPSCVVWFLKFNSRSVRFPGWISDFFGDFRRNDIESCRYAKFESKEHSLFYSQCRGRYIVLCEIFERQSDLLAVALIYIVVAGPLAFRYSSRLLPFLVAGSFLLAPAVAFALHRLVYRGQSQCEKLSTYELDEWLQTYPKEEWLDSISAYFEKCSGYIHTRASVNIVCVVIVSIQAVAVYTFEGALL